MGISVFLISTPSQAFFLDKANKVKPDSVLIITTATKKKKNEILQYLNNYNWSRIIYWKIPRSNRRSEYWKLGWLQLKCLRFITLNGNKIDKIFIGSYANIFHRNFVSYFSGNFKINLVYDGLQVIAVSKNRLEGMDKFKSLPLLYRLLLYRNSQVQSLNYLVPFNFEIPENDSIEVFQIGQEEKVRYDKEKIFFIGQPLESIKAVSQDYYLEALKRFISEYQNKTVLYIPHPREKKEKIELISKMCKVFKPGKVFEEYYFQATERPQNVASFYSSVLLNLYAIDKQINIISISIPFTELLHPRFEKVLNPIYNFFNSISENRFQIVNLN